MTDEKEPMKKKKMSANRERLYKQIDERTRVISHPTTVNKTVSIVCNGFPEETFFIWKEECARYNDIYWVKMWSDHLKAQAYDCLIAKLSKAAEIQVSQEDVKEEDNKENDEPIVFGDGA